MGLLLLFFGCERNSPNLSSDQRADQLGHNQSPSKPFIRSAKLVPRPLTRNAPIEVQIETDPSSLLPVTFLYQWIVNGVPMNGETKRTLDPSGLKRGDRIGVDLIPMTAGNQGTPYHVEGIVRNSIPILRSVVILPNVIRVTTSLQAQADVIDVDHDLVHLTYRWRCNNLIVKEDDDGVFEPAGCRTGDRVTVEVIPADFVEVGQAVRSESIIIENSPPTVIEPPPPMTNLDRYEYIVQAQDADGDPLQFSLHAAPSGMTIDKESGRVVWVIPPGTSGTHTAEIVVQDNHGGSAIQDIELILSPAAQS